MKLIHFSDMHLGFNDLDTHNNVGNGLCTSILQSYVIYFTYPLTILFEYFLLYNMAIFTTLSKAFNNQDENRKIEILEAFHAIKEQYGQIFLISHKVEIKEMFERIVEL